MTVTSDDAHTTRAGWSRSRVLIPLGAVLAVATVIVMIVLLRADNTQGEPRTLDAALAASQRSWDRYAAGDIAGQYDLYGKSVQDRIKKDEFTDLITACNQVLGGLVAARVTVTDPRWVGEPGGTVAVTVRNAMAATTRTLVYEDGRWVPEPSETTTALIETFKTSGRDAAVREHCTEE